MRSAKRPLSRGSNQVASSPPEGVVVRKGLALPGGPENSSVGAGEGVLAALAKSVAATAKRAGCMKEICCISSVSGT